jgi:hypothetical protein
MRADESAAVAWFKAHAADIVVDVAWIEVVSA